MKIPAALWAAGFMTFLILQLALGQSQDQKLWLIPKAVVLALPALAPAAVVSEAEPWRK